MLLAEMGPADRPVIAISAAVHGDEPAGAWALLSLVRDGLLDPRFAYRLWPCLNPSGFDARTRVNADGFDVNRSFGPGGSTPEAKAVLTADRDRRFALAIDLHEDTEADGFYVYENGPAGWAARYAPAVTTAVSDAGFPLQHFAAGFDLGPPGSELAQQRSPGNVIVDSTAEARLYGRALPRGIGVLSAAPCALTFETPAGRSPAERIAMHRVAVVAAIAQALSG
jgi:hypothetical protein